MKNTIAVLIVLFLAIPAFAQENSMSYSNLNSYLLAEKSNHGLLISKNNAPVNGKRFTKLYNQQHPASKKSSRHITFMDGPVVFSSTPADLGGSPNSLLLSHAAATKDPSGAAVLLGFAASFIAPALAPKANIQTEPTPVQAYLQSTYRQQHQ